MDRTFWKKQTSSSPLFPDIEWNKPEQRTKAGRLGIIGGNKLGFAGVAEAYATTIAGGSGEVRVLLPDVLKKTIPAAMTDVQFGATNPSGGLASGAQPEMKALAEWASGVLMIGDAGRNSETAILYENFAKDYTGPLVVSRDAVDLLRTSAATLVERPQTTLIVSFAQLQKLFQAVHYPKVLTFSMQLAQLVDAVHKFTITYPICVVVLHQEHLIVSHDGAVVSTEWDNPMAIWRGHTAARAASYLLWSPDKPLEAVVASLIPA